ncbi:MAG: hypothetical protein ACK4TA_12065 [Saprospiraceae bacterium]
MKYQLKLQIITLVVTVGLIGMHIAACSNAEGGASAVKAPTKDAPIAGTTEQQQRYRETFQPMYSRDSVWSVAFETAFANAFGQDSLKKFLSRKDLPRIAFSQNHEINGTERGEFVVNSGVTLTINGIVYGRITILKGGYLRNNGAVYGNIENLGGQFEDNGFLQGALLTR